MKNFIFSNIAILFCLLLLSACTQSSKGRIEATNTSINKTAILTASPTPIPTKIATPNPTLIPTQTPTATYLPITPVWSGTQVPESAASISVDNINRITLLSRWGNGNISKMQYSPDGINLMVATTTGLYFYETSSYSLIDYIDPQAAILDIDIASDNQIIAALSSDEVLLYDFYSREQLRSIKVKAISIALSPDGKILATGTIDGGEGYIQLWDLNRGIPVQDFQKIDGWIYSLVFSPDGRFLASGTASTSIWDLEGTLIDEYGPYNSGGSTESLSFSPDGTLLAEGTDDDILRLWRVLDTGILISSRQIALDNYGVEHLSFSPDGKTLAVGTKSGIYLWDINSGAQTLTLTTDSTMSRTLAWSIDGKTLATSSSTKGLEIWNVNDGNKITGLDSLTGALRVLDWSPTGEMIAMGTDEKIVQVLEAPSGDLLYALQCYGGVHNIDFSPDGQILAVGLDRDKVELWGMDGGLSTTIEGALDVSVTNVTFSPDGSWLITNLETINPEGESYAAVSLQIWQTDGWELTESWEIGDLVLIETLELAPDGEISALALSQNFKDSIEIWDLIQGEKIYTIKVIAPGKPLATASISFSPDGQTMALLSRRWVGNFISGIMEEWVTLWETENWEILWSSDDLFTDQRKGLPGFYPNGVTWSNDGSLIAVGASNGNINILRESDGKLLQTLSGHTMWVTGLQFSPDGQILASISLDGTIRLWGIR